MKPLCRNVLNYTIHWSILVIVKLVDDVDDVQCHETIKPFFFWSICDTCSRDQIKQPWCCKKNDVVLLLSTMMQNSCTVGVIKIATIWKSLRLVRKQYQSSITLGQDPVVSGPPWAIKLRTSKLGCCFPLKKLQNDLPSLNCCVFLWNLL